jgi:prepilin-type N-terminal cleavage/methylation domain-containing protein/prepilin-type processing-associated H-X9-DG protein
MKIKLTSRDGNAFTLVEMLVVIVVLAVLVAMILPALTAAKRKGGPNCINNLKQMGLSFRLWEGDNGDKYPMEISMTNADVMKLIANGNAYVFWQMMSNQLSTPKILHCPEDTKHIAATDFSIGFSDANISYFFGLDTSENNPQALLAGDDNFAVNGKPVRPGILNLSTNAPVTWTKERHNGAGNIGLADGSVQAVTGAGLNATIANGVATNSSAVRLVIP